MTMNARESTGARQSGFTLVEAMIALLVMAFGMLAIAGFQITLSRGSDVAKQRSEAVRLAQQKMEDLRSYTQLASDGVGGVIDYAADLRGSAVLGTETVAPGSTHNANTYSTNTTFRRTWTVTADGTTAVDPAGSDPQKWISVIVEWADRTAASPTAYNQSVTLTSVIGRADPGAIRFIQNNAGSTTSRKPKNRSINIPYPATDLGTGRSAFAPGGSLGVYFVFDNVTGLVTYRCTGSTLLDPNAPAATCSAFSTSNVVLSGYIYWYTPNAQPTAGDLTLSLTGNNNNLQDPPPLDYTLLNSTTGETNAVDIEFYAPTASATSECFIQQQMVLSSTGQIAAFSASSRYYAFSTYLCVVQPVSVSGSAPKWFGQFTLKTDGSHLLGTGSSNYKVCRFTGDYNGNDQLSNSEHPLFYRDVVDTIDNQNYVVVAGNHNCPSDTEMNPFGSPAKFTNNNTELHQHQVVDGINTRPYGGVRSTTASQWPTAGQEPATETDSVPME
jgi:Tfp pilus assembly protein PilV